MLRSFEEILACALPIEAPIALRWKISGQFVDEIFRPKVNYPHDYKFAVENGVLAFVKGRVTYVIPATQNVKEVFSKQRVCIIQDKVYVPLSHGELPLDKDLLNKWQDLLERAEANDL